MNLYKILLNSLVKKIKDDLKFKEKKIYAVS